MARWQLTEASYLNVPGNLWEQQITDRATGRPVRKQFPVPLHLDPNIESDWNHKEQLGNNIIDGKIIVCHAGKGEPKDIIFEGPPNPGMLPLDDEAREISGKYSWTPTRGLDDRSQAESFQQQLLVTLSASMDSVKNAQAEIPGMSELMKALAAMMSQQTAILAALAGKPGGSAGSVALPGAEVVYDALQHVKDDAEPLGEAEPTEAEVAVASAQAVAADLAAGNRARNKAINDSLRR